jgi:hypothetical protein
MRWRSRKCRERGGCEKERDGRVEKGCGEGGGTIGFGVEEERKIRRMRQQKLKIADNNTDDLDRTLVMEKMAVEEGRLRNRTEISTNTRSIRLKILTSSNTLALDPSPSIFHSSRLPSHPKNSLLLRPMFGTPSPFHQPLLKNKETKGLQPVRIVFFGSHRFPQCTRGKIKEGIVGTKRSSKDAGSTL